MVSGVSALAALLSGCGGDESEPAAAPKPTATASAAASAPAPGAPGGAGGTSVRPVSAPQPQMAAGDLANFSCEQRRRMWSASGDVSNSAKEPMVYTVTVVAVSGADVAGDETEEFVLEPGDTEHFEMPGVASGSVDTCMPRVVRTPR
jgi:hypothetical protein